MAIDIKKLPQRAEQLRALAKKSGLNSIDQELSRLPAGDIAARIGYLAHALGIDFGIAFDVESPLEPQEA